MKRFATTAALVLAACTALSPISASAGIPVFSSTEKVPTLAPMIKQVSPAVVNISTRGHIDIQANPFFNDPFFQQFFGLPNQPQQTRRQFQSLGSGVIVNADKGYILTNNHVVEHADSITVTLFDNRSFKGKVIGTDPDTDLAVVQIKAANLTAIPLGDSDALQVGDFVVAIGNPFGLNHTVTSGIVSAKGRAGIEDGKYENFIQTDASINPGNSGGALVNLEGQLVGINTAILSKSGGNIGIGFAIPINMGKAVMDQIIKYGKVERGMLGIYMQPLTPDLAQALGIHENQGAVVTRVVAGSGAAKAGVKQGDVIVSVNGRPVGNADELRSTIGVMRRGSKVKLGIFRDGKSLTLTATLGKLESESQNNGGSAKGHPDLHGLSVGNLDQNSPLYGQVRGVVVTAVSRDSDAYYAGIRAGDVITEVNRRPVKNVAEFRAAVERVKGTLLFTVQRGNGVFFAVIK